MSLLKAKKKLSNTSQKGGQCSPWGWDLCLCYASIGECKSDTGVAAIGIQVKEKYGTETTLDYRKYRCWMLLWDLVAGTHEILWNLSWTTNNGLSIFTKTKPTQHQVRCLSEDLQGKAADGIERPAWFTAISRNQIRCSGFRFPTFKRTGKISWQMSALSHLDLATWMRNYQGQISEMLPF